MLSVCFNGTHFPFASLQEESLTEKVKLLSAPVSALWEMCLAVPLQSSSASEASENKNILTALSSLLHPLCNGNGVVPARKQAVTTGVPCCGMGSWKLSSLVGERIGARCGS